MQKWLDDAKDRRNTLEINNDPQFKELMRSFKSIHDTIAKTKKARQGILDVYDNIVESLTTISASIDIRTQFTKLVERYLSFFYEQDMRDKKSSENVKAGANVEKFLIIPIDDMDLLTTNVLEYTEEIKKFMNIPHVIILINYDLDRYSQVILNYYLKYNKKLELYAQNSDYEDLRKRVREQLSIVTNYMDKVFPIDQRVILPSLANMLERCDYEFYHTRGENDRKQIKNKRLNDNDKLKLITNRWGMHADRLDKLFLSSIFNLTKVRIPFQGCSTNYLPINLRELHNYLKDLYLSCGEYINEKNDVDSTNVSINREKITKSYEWLALDIIHRWGKENLTRLQYLFLVEMWDAPSEQKLMLTYEFFLKSEKTLNSITKYGRRREDRGNASQKKDLIKNQDFVRYFDRSKKSKISFGDLFYICDYFIIHDLVNEGKWENFSFAILTLLSINLKLFEHSVENANKKLEEVLEEIMPNHLEYFGFSSLPLLNVELTKSEIDDMVYDKFLKELIATLSIRFNIEIRLESPEAKEKIKRELLNMLKSDESGINELIQEFINAISNKNGEQNGKSNKNENNSIIELFKELKEKADTIYESLFHCKTDKGKYLIQCGRIEYILPKGEEFSVLDRLEFSNEICNLVDNIFKESWTDKNKNDIVFKRQLIKIVTAFSKPNNLSALYSYLFLCKNETIACFDILNPLYKISEIIDIINNKWLKLELRLKKETEKEEFKIKKARLDKRVVQCKAAILASLLNLHKAIEDSIEKTIDCLFNNDDAKSQIENDKDDKYKIYYIRKIFKKRDAGKTLQMPLSDLTFMAQVINKLKEQFVHSKILYSTIESDNRNEYIQHIGEIYKKMEKIMEEEDKDIYSSGKFHDYQLHLYIRILKDFLDTQIYEQKNTKEKNDLRIKLAHEFNKLLLYSDCNHLMRIDNQQNIQ